MKKSGLKKLFAIVFVLAILLIAGALLAPQFIPVGPLKEKVIAQVEKDFGRKLTIEGDVKLAFFPTATLYMEKVTLSGRLKDGDTSPFATLKSADVNVRVLPLLNGVVELTSLVLTEPHINLRVNKAGRNNWDFSDAALSPVYAQSAWMSSAQAQDASRLNDIRLGDVEINGGSISFKNEQTGAKWQFDKLNLAAKLKTLASPLKLNGSAQWNKKLIRMNLEADNLRSYLDGKDTKINLGVTSDHFTLQSAGKWAAQKYTGNASFTSPSLREAMLWAAPGSKMNTNAPLAANLSGDVLYSSSLAQFTKASVKLDKIEATGDVKVHLERKVPLIDLNVTTQELDVTPYMPKEMQSFAPGLLISNAYAAGAWSTDPMDLSALRGFDINANISAALIKVRKILINNTTLDARLQGGKLRGSVKDAGFYGGKANITFDIDASSTIPIFNKQVSFAGVQAEPFMKDAGISERFSGSASMQGSFSAHGRSQYEIVSSLQGSGNVKILDGAIKGYDIASMARNIQSAFKQVDSGSQKTDFAELGGTFTIMQGIVSNKDLAMKAPLVRLSGAGQVNLPLQTINYRLVPQIVETTQGQGGKDKEGLAVPVIVEGTLDNPHFRPDLNAMVQDALKDPEKLKTTVKDIKTQLKEGKGGLKDLLKNF